LAPKKWSRTEIENFSFDPKTSSMIASKDSTKSLKESLVDVFHSVGRRGCLNIEMMYKLQFFLKTGGPNWCLRYTAFFLRI
jgi:hypothetical protein